MLTLAQRQTLLTLGRAAVEARLRRRDGAPPAALDQALRAPRGVFATWWATDGGLRGCIGFPLPRDPLHEAVPRAAVEAAFEDPRFAPVTLEEWPGLSLELSVLSALAPVDDPALIEPGRHGVVIALGTHVGLFLPRVASDHGWDRRTLLEQACLKAGLPPDAWRHGGQLQSFTAEVFCT